MSTLKRGWELKPGAAAPGGKTTLQFTKGDRLATIIISLEPDGRTRVAVEITTP